MREAGSCDAKKAWGQRIQAGYLLFLDWLVGYKQTVMAPAWLSFWGLSQRFNMKLRIKSLFSPWPKAASCLASLVSAPFHPQAVLLNLAYLIIFPFLASVDLSPQSFIVRSASISDSSCHSVMAEARVDHPVNIP